MRALVTGFEPFGGETVNPSAELLHRLPPRLGMLELTTGLLPTSFGRARPVLDALLDAHGPDLVLAVGQAAGRGRLSLERVAINVMDATLPDNDGERPVDRPVVEDGPGGYFSTLPLKRAVAALAAAGLPAEISNSAGTYVCNQVFYAALHRAAQGRDRYRAGFLHVPLLPQQAARRDAASMAIEHVVQGVQIILAVAAEWSADGQNGGATE
jgi:pyroglutamyl-peptidase